MLWVLLHEVSFVANKNMEIAKPGAVCKAKKINIFTAHFKRRDQQHRSPNRQRRSLAEAHTFRLVMAS